MLVKKSRIKLYILIITATFTVLAFCSSTVNATIYDNLPKSTTSENFPASYVPYIDALKKIYPNAKFIAQYTNLDWNTVLQHESYEVNVGISTIHSSYEAAWKRDGVNNYVDGPFVTASKAAVAYVLDPRNSLSEGYVFQFELLTYNKDMNASVIDKVLTGTETVGEHKSQYQSGTAGNWINMGMTYSDVICKVAMEQDVSSVYIASRMKQETGCKISTNGSINGISSTYPGVYNFFNIGAVPNSDGSGAITNGLRTANSKGWTTPYLSISGGVGIIKKGYITYGQYSTYYQKFDVNNPYGNAKALVYKQYQTNILAPRSESLISHAAYKNLNMLNTAFIFYIPVYENMPSTACPKPGTTTKTDMINIGDFGITGVNPSTSMGELKSKIVSDGLTVNMKNILGKVLTETENVGTGTIVELYTEAGELAKSYNVTIYGDITGDGLVNSADLLKLRQHMLGKTKLTGCQFDAANINRTDALANSADLLKLRQHMLGKSLIVQ